MGSYTVRRIKLVRRSHGLSKGRTLSIYLSPGGIPSLLALNLPKESTLYKHNSYWKNNKNNVRLSTSTKILEDQWISSRYTVSEPPRFSVQDR